MPPFNYPTFYPMKSASPRNRGNRSTVVVNVTIVRITPLRINPTRLVRISFTAVFGRSKYIVPRNARRKLQPRIRSSSPNRGRLSAIRVRSDSILRIPSEIRISTNFSDNTATGLNLPGIVFPGARPKHTRRANVRTGARRSRDIGEGRSGRERKYLLRRWTGRDDELTSAV